MPSSPFKQFMERRKPSKTIDELAIVKAAAWSWYQRGSGSEGRLMREYDVTRTCRAHAPSRYKLEAMRKAQDSPISGGSSSVTDTSLLDTLFNGDGGGHRRIVSLPESEAISGVIKNKKMMRKKVKGFWVWPGGVCGSRDDVVERGGFGVGSRRKSR
ncbi:hypothetical protein F0562_004118 [Nyssa sinensis]|uniref:Uncharacterized protein n=1 Tax=Nyssa sinensis TaxID=561372 RepID=A0A5J5BXQ5_9ASTE|nr:hypothetical protein F0562_004118 [Nyssa sinensis]